jgi:hypothetical protein
MSDSINPNQRSKSSLMNNATRSESPNSIPTAVNFYGTMNFNNTGPINFGSGVGEVKDIVDHLHSDPLSPQADKYLTDAQINKYLKRMVPYSSGLKGTSLHMAKEKNKLLSLVGSPLLKIDGTWRWFITFAQADVYEPRLYEICLEDNSGQVNHNWCWSDRQRIAEELTKEEREKYLNGILH